MITDLQEEIQKISEMAEISLRPLWYGSIDWSNGCTVNPKMVEYYKTFDFINNKNNLWSDFVSPIYNENLEYIRNLKSSSNNYNNKNIMLDAMDTMDTMDAMNADMNADINNFMSFRKPRDRKNQKYKNNTFGKRYYRFEDANNDSNCNEYVNGYVNGYVNDENIFQNVKKHNKRDKRDKHNKRDKYNENDENNYILDNEENNANDNGNDNDNGTEILSDPDNYEDGNKEHN